MYLLLLLGWRRTVGSRWLRGVYVVILRSRVFAVAGMFPAIVGVGPVLPVTGMRALAPVVLLWRELWWGKSLLLLLEVEGLLFDPLLLLLILGVLVDDVAGGYQLEATEDDHVD